MAILLCRAANALNRHCEIVEIERGQLRVLACSVECEAFGGFRNGLKIGRGEAGEVNCNFFQGQARL